MQRAFSILRGNFPKDTHGTKRRRNRPNIKPRRKEKDGKRSSGKADDRTVQINPHWMPDSGTFGSFHVNNHDLDDAVRSKWRRHSFRPCRESKRRPCPLARHRPRRGPRGQNLDRVGEDDDNEGRSSGVVVVTDTKEQFAQTNNRASCSGVSRVGPPRSNFI